jgi:hypothetical protein
MNIKKGQSRTVILLGDFVFKFPRILPFITAFKMISSLAKGRGMDKLDEYTFQLSRNATKKFIASIEDNINEYLLWLKLKAIILPKTHFSLGFITVQNFEKGTILSKEEFWDIFKTIDARTRDERRQLSSHSFSPQNLIKTKNGLRLIDYGFNRKQKGVSLDIFLIKWIKVLEEEFSKIIP